MSCSRCFHRAKAQSSTLASCRARSRSLARVRTRQTISTTSSTESPVNDGRHADPGKSGPPPPSAAADVVAVAAAAPRPRPIKKVRSLVPEGAPLRGLNFLKNQGDPVAMADDHYPDWLWTCLDTEAETKRSGPGGTTAGGRVPTSLGLHLGWDQNWSRADEHTSTDGWGRYLVQAAKKKAKGSKSSRRKTSAEAESMEPSVPLEQQTVDLASNGRGNIEGALEAVDARDVLTKAMRVKRRAIIKESNFLEGMR